MHPINMPSHKLIHASPPQSQNVLRTYLCGAQMEPWIRLLTYPCVKTMEFWNRLWTYQRMNSRIIQWNCQTGSECTHLSQKEFWIRLWMYTCLSGTGSEHMHVSQSWNSGTASEHTQMSQRRNSGTGPECAHVSHMEFWKRFWAYPHVTNGILEEAVIVSCQRQNFWTRLWIYSCIIETEFWTRLWMYPCVRDGTVGYPLYLSWR